MSLAGELRRLRRTIPRLEAEVAAKVIAVEASRDHQENFRARNFAGRNRWPGRKKPDTTRALLVKTGRLRRAATSGRSSGNQASFVMPLYGKVHNEGLRSGRGSGFTMPRRQFAGRNQRLEARIRLKAGTLINRHLKGR